MSVFVTRKTGAQQFPTAQPVNGSDGKVYLWARFDRAVAKGTVLRIIRDEKGWFVPGSEIGAADLRYYVGVADKTVKSGEYEMAQIHGFYKDAKFPANINTSTNKFLASHASNAGFIGSADQDGKTVFAIDVTKSRGNTSKKDIILSGVPVWS